MMDNISHSHVHHYNHISSSSRPLGLSSRNHTSPNLLEYGAASVPPPPQQLPLSRKTSGGQRYGHNSNNTATGSPNKTTSTRKQGSSSGGAVVIAVEDDEDDVFPMLQHNADDVIPGPPAGIAVPTRTEKSTSRSRGLIQRVLHAGGGGGGGGTTSASSHYPASNSHNHHHNGAASNARNRSSSVEDVLDLSQLSNTEHNWAGAGILANRQDLEMPPEQFAAGCNLLQAAARGDVATMRTLLASSDQHKTDVDFRDYDRRTAIHVAASEGHLDVCRFLIEDCQARINRSDRWGGSPLDDAHRHRHQPVALYLRAKGASTGSGNRLVNFIKAAADGDLDEVTLILDATAKEAKSLAERKRSSGIAGAAAPLFDINKGDYDNRTALHLAAGEGHEGIVEALCKAGADVNVEDRWHRTPLDDAIQNRHEECQTILERHGAHVGSAASMVQEQSQNTLDASSRRQQDNMQVQFDELEMIDKIGSGAFGEIYKCRWRGTLVAAKIIKTAKIRRDWVHKRVTKALGDGIDVDDAIKEIDEAEVDQEAKVIALADFRQEISVLKGLRHPHIVLLLAYSTTENYECLISELMKCSLLDIFKAHIIQGSKMRLRTSIVYARQLAQGMAYLHSCRPPVIHRDLKPANLLIDHSGMLKISDFGLSKVRPDPETKEKDTFTMTGETGSYRFMAPEVFLHQDYNETVDVYSYAMILFYLLVGRPPWPQLPGMEAVKRAAEQGDRPMIPRELDVRLQTLIKECWDENPSLRPSFTTITKILAAYSKDVFHEDENDVSVAQQATGTECNCKDYCVIS